MIMSYVENKRVKCYTLLYCIMVLELQVYSSEDFMDTEPKRSRGRPKGTGKHSGRAGYITLSVGLRYQILARDAHTCRYCGRSAADGPLCVDHVISQAAWRKEHGNLIGVSHPSNLVTSCFDCNLGKKAENGNPPQKRITDNPLYAYF
jgi:hypothetical protein